MSAAVILAPLGEGRSRLVQPMSRVTYRNGLLLWPPSGRAPAWLSAPAAPFPRWPGPAKQRDPLRALIDFGSPVLRVTQTATGCRCEARPKGRDDSLPSASRIDHRRTAPILTSTRCQTPGASGEGGSGPAHYQTLTNATRTLKDQIAVVGCVPKWPHPLHGPDGEGSFGQTVPGARPVQPGPACEQKSLLVVVPVATPSGDKDGGRWAVANTSTNQVRTEMLTAG